MKLKTYLLFFMLMFLVTPMLAAQDVTYTFEMIDPPGADLALASGINNAGEIVGTYRDADGVIHGFLLVDDEYTNIDAPEATVTFATGINDEGIVIGTYADADGNSHGFILADNEFTSIDYPDSPSTSLSGINNEGQIVGSYTDADGNSHAFLFSDDEFTSIDFPDIANTFGNGINDAGIIVGETYCDSCEKGQQGYWLEADKFTLIEYPEAFVIGARGIDNSGQIVGIYHEPDPSQPPGYDFSKPRGFLMDAEGHFTLLDFPDMEGTSPNAINNEGVIVGSFRDADGKQHSFRAVPG